MKLINKTTQQEVKIGDEVIDFRGDKHILTHFDSKRVYCKTPNSDFSRQWFPDVINCEIQHETN